MGRNLGDPSRSSLDEKVDWKVLNEPPQIEEMLVMMHTAYFGSIPEKKRGTN